MFFFFFELPAPVLEYKTFAILTGKKSSLSWPEKKTIQNKQLKLPENKIAFIKNTIFKKKIYKTVLSKNSNKHKILKKFLLALFGLSQSKSGFPRVGAILVSWRAIISKVVVINVRNGFIWNVVECLNMSLIFMLIMKILFIV